MNTLLSEVFSEKYNCDYQNLLKGNYLSEFYTKSDKEKVLDNLGIMPTIKNIQTSVGINSKKIEDANNRIANIDQQMTRIPTHIVGSFNNNNIISAEADKVNTTLKFKTVSSATDENTVSVVIPIANIAQTGVLLSAEYEKFTKYNDTITSNTSRITGAELSIKDINSKFKDFQSTLNLTTATANTANAIAQNLNTNLVPKIEATANEGKALATTCRTLIDSTNSNVSKLFELNVVYPSNIQSLTVGSSTTEVKNAFIPIIGGTTGVVNTPHVGYLIQTTGKPDCLIISVEKKLVSSFTTESFVILYLKNDSTIVELTVNLDSYSVVSVVEKGKLSDINDKLSIHTDDINNIENEVNNLTEQVNTIEGKIKLGDGLKYDDNGYITLDIPEGYQIALIPETSGNNYYYDNSTGVIAIGDLDDSNIK